MHCKQGVDSEPHVDETCVRRIKKMIIMYFLLLLVLVQLYILNLQYLLNLVLYLNLLLCIKKKYGVNATPVIGHVDSHHELHTDVEWSSAATCTQLLVGLRA